MDKEYKEGSVVIMKKQHPCGANSWEITRLGADIKIKCLTLRNLTKKFLITNLLIQFNALLWHYTLIRKLNFATP